MLNERNADGISILYDKYAPAIYGAVVNKVDTVETAEAILEQTFLYIWNNPLIEARFTNRLLLLLLNTAKMFTAKIFVEIEQKNVVHQNTSMPSPIVNPQNSWCLRPLELYS